MTQGAGGQSPPIQHGNASSTTEAARDEAREVASTAVDRASSVKDTALEEVKHVASHARHETRDLLREGREQLQSQAKDGQTKAARSLHDLADQLERMAEREDSPGLASDLTKQVSGRARTVAGWLEDREPGDLLDEVRRFARRRPGAFLAGAAVAGALVGRLTRGVIAQQHEDSAQESAPAHAGGVRPAATPPLPATQRPLPQPLPQPLPPQPSVGGTVPPAPAAPGGFNAPQVPGAVPPAGPPFASPGQVP